MAVNPSLTQIFGSTATQDATNLTIKKVDLQSPTNWTFTPAANNNAEALFVALLLKARLGQDVSTDAELVLSDITQSLITRNNVRVRRYSCTVEWYTTDSTIINVDAL